MITILLHLLPTILSVVLLTKTVLMLKRLRKNKKDMYFLSRIQVTHVIRALVSFSIIYVILQAVLFFSGQWIPAKGTDFLHYGNETALIAALIYLIYKFKRK